MGHQDRVWGGYGGHGAHWDGVWGRWGIRMVSDVGKQGMDRVWGSYGRCGGTSGWGLR